MLCIIHTYTWPVSSFFCAKLVLINDAKINRSNSLPPPQRQWADSVTHYMYIFWKMWSLLTPQKDLLDSRQSHSSDKCYAFSRALPSTNRHAQQVISSSSSLSSCSFFFPRRLTGNPLHLVATYMYYVCVHTTHAAIFPPYSSIDPRGHTHPGRLLIVLQQQHFHSRYPI